MSGVYITNNNIAIWEEVHKEWKKQLNQFGKIYLYAMSGFGKSKNAKAFAEKHFSKWIRISAGEEDFLEKTERYFLENKKSRVRTLLILDDLQWLSDESEQQKLVEVLDNLNRIGGKLQCMLLSRAPLPGYLKPLYLTKELAVVNKEDLWLKEDQIGELLKKENLINQSDEDGTKNLVKLCMRITKGYPIGLSSVIRQLKEGITEYESIDNTAREDIFQYFDRTLFVRWGKEQREAIIKLAVYDKFNIAMAECILGEEAKYILDSIMSISSFFNFTPPDEYEIRKFFLAYLRSRMNNNLREELNVIYYNAGMCYEKMRNFEQALCCYKNGGQSEKLAELIIYLSENADGCNFARIGSEYLKYVPKYIQENNVKMLGAKTMLLSYEMRIKESNECLDRLKNLVDDEKKKGSKSGVLAIYIRTLIALPHGTAEELKGKLRCFYKYVLKYDILLKNIMPTGNMPSIINGGLDLLKWEKNDKFIHPIMQKSAIIIMGKEAVGITDVSIGENLYEKNKKTEAMRHLTKGLSQSKNKGSIPVQYAATAAMARIFQSDGQTDTAEVILKKIKDKAIEISFLELIPNIEASLVSCALLKGNMDKIIKWFEKYSPNEHETFFITDRFRLITKARVYISMSRYFEALYILNLLEEYANIYNRKYIHMEINILKSIILFRRGEEWDKLLIETVQKAATYSYIHIISDNGGAMLQLWGEIDWNLTRLDPNYINIVTIELKKMASYYPNYLNEIKPIEILSKKETEVIKLIAKGYTNGEISKELQVSTSTVKFHISNLLKKLNADNRTMAAKIAQEKRLL